MTKGGSSPVLVENSSNKKDGNGATPTAKKRGFFSGSFRRRRNSDIKINDTIIINENVVFNGNNKTATVDGNGKQAIENGKTTAVEQHAIVNDKKPPLQQKQQPDNKKATVVAAAVQQKTVADSKKQQQQQQQQQSDKNKTIAVDDKKKPVTKRGN